MSEPGDSGAEDYLSSGLRRSFSDHADIVLKHFQHHRRRLSPESTLPRCSRSGPSFQYLPEDEDADRARNTKFDICDHSEADDEDDDAEECNRGQRTWRISSASEEQIPSQHHQQQQQQHRRKIVECGCGDTNELAAKFSEMSLERDSCHYESNTILEPKFSSAESHDTRATVSSFDLRYNTSENDFSAFEQAFAMDDPGLYRRIIDHKRSRADRGDHAELDEMNAFIGIQSECSESTPRPDNYTHLTDHHREEDDRVPQLVGFGSAYSTSSICSEITENETAAERRARHHNGVIRKISYENWAQEKKKELQRRKDEARLAEIKKRELEEQEKKEREERERKDYENFIKWVEHKKQQKILQNKLRQKEQELQKKIEETEGKLKDVKDVSLMQWRRRKEQQQKEFEKKQLMKKKRAEEEKKKRLEESFQAYQKWREKAKSTPRPATQGLLPHQKAKPAFTNPEPWQPLVENRSDESDDGLQVKPSNATLKSQQRRRPLVKR